MCGDDCNVVVDICGGGEVQGEAGVVTSPGYPGNYPARTSCTLTITAATQPSITINFTHFSLESDDTCRWDYVEVR